MLWTGALAGRSLTLDCLDNMALRRRAVGGRGGFGADTGARYAALVDDRWCIGLGCGGSSNGATFWELVECDGTLSAFPSHPIWCYPSLLMNAVSDSLGSREGHCVGIFSHTVCTGVEWLGTTLVLGSGSCTLN